MSKKNMGSSIDSFIEEEGIFEKIQAQAVKEVVAWQISKNKMAMLLKTSRSQIDHLPDVKNDMALSSLRLAAAMFGPRVRRCLAPVSQSSWLKRAG